MPTHGTAPQMRATMKVTTNSHVNVAAASFALSGRSCLATNVVYCFTLGAGT